MSGIAAGSQVAERMGLLAGTPRAAVARGRSARIAKRPTPRLHGARWRLQLAGTDVHAALSIAVVAEESGPTLTLHDHPYGQNTALLSLRLEFRRRPAPSRGTPQHRAGGAHAPEPLQLELRGSLAHALRSHGDHLRRFPRSDARRSTPRLRHDEGRQRRMERAPHHPVRAVGVPTTPHRHGPDPRRGRLHPRGATSSTKPGERVSTERTSIGGGSICGSTTSTSTSDGSTRPNA
jgi:hypothetical protein